MRYVLGALVLLFNLTDNTTTFLCLRQPVPGFSVIEANPLARWLFEAVGLANGLVLEMLLTTVAVAFLVWTRRLAPNLRTAILCVLAVLPAWASVNNYLVLRTLQGAGGWL